MGRVFYDMVATTDDGRGGQPYDRRLVGIAGTMARGNTEKYDQLTHRQRVIVKVKRMVEMH